MNDNGVLLAFGQRVREERTRLGLSQEQLAHLAQLDRTYVSDVERGSRNLGLRNLAALAAALTLEPADLLRPHIPIATPNQLAYRYDPKFRLSCGFNITAEHVVAAMIETGSVMGALPLTLFTTIDFKTQSGIVGAVFSAAIASQCSAIVNPIEKGHPDVLPASALNATEAQLRNYPTGLEVKCTIGSVVQGSNPRAGVERVELISGVTWQAHHRGVRALMGLVWDFVGGSARKPAHPAITGIYFAGRLVEDDWGKISGTTGRNTKVTGMVKSGHKKMAAGAIAVLDDDRNLTRYASKLGVTEFPNLSQKLPG